jgi:hypothetical protein
MAEEVVVEGVISGVVVVVLFVVEFVLFVVAAGSMLLHSSVKTEK